MKKVQKRTIVGSAIFSMFICGNLCKSAVVHTIQKNTCSLSIYTLLKNLTGFADAQHLQILKKQYKEHTDTLFSCSYSALQVAGARTNPAPSDTRKCDA